MIFLALETTHEACSVGLVEEQKVLCEKILKIQRGHAEVLMPMIQEVLQKERLDFSDLTRIAVSVGPGSFTGVRVGVACANGLALASGLPVLGVSVLEAMAFKTMKLFPQTKRLNVVLETKRDDFYFQTFEKGQPSSQACAKTAEEIKAFHQDVFVGNALERLQRDIGKLKTLDIEMVSACDIAFFAQNKTLEKKYAHPLYLREAEVNLCPK